MLLLLLLFIVCYFYKNAGAHNTNIRNGSSLLRSNEKRNNSMIEVFVKKYCLFAVGHYLHVLALTLRGEKTVKLLF